MTDSQPAEGNSRRGWLVILANQPHRLTVGGEVPFQADGRPCKAIFRQAVRAEDQRAGFDVTCTTEPAGG